MNWPIVFAAIAGFSFLAFWLTEYPVAPWCALVFAISFSLHLGIGAGMTEHQTALALFTSLLAFSGVLAIIGAWTERVRFTYIALGWCVLWGVGATIAFLA